MQFRSVQPSPSPQKINQHKSRSLGGGLKYVCSWENDPNLTNSYFFKWLGSTTNYRRRLEDSQKMLLVGYHMTLSAEVMEIDRNSLSENTIFLRIPWIAQAVGLPCRMASPCEACVDGRVAQGVRCAVVMSS